MIEYAGILLPRIDGEGKQIVSPSPATDGWKTWFSGRGDDVGTQSRGTGTALKLDWVASDPTPTKTVEIQFLEPIELHDGQCSWYPVDNWDAGDELSFYLKMEPTGTAVNATNTGNCNLTDIGGYNLITPAAGDGTHDVVLADAVPVAASGAGYWDADYETGDITASATPGEATWNLIDTITVKAHFIKCLPLGNPLGVFDVDTYLVQWIHPNHKLAVEVTKNSATLGTLSAWLQAFRRKNT